MKNTLCRWVIRMLALCLVLLAIPSVQALAAYSGTPKTPTQINSSTYAALGLTSENWNQFDGYYGIRNAEELYGFAKLANNENRFAKAVLLQDIVVNETVSASGAAHTWTPIGTSYDTHFNGAFDGNGHTISGLYYNAPTASYVGLFGYVGFDTTNISISNVTLANSYLRGSQYVGGIAGFLVGENVHISGCKIEQDVTVCAATTDDKAFLGGISGGTGSNTVGQSTIRTVKNCVVLGSIVREKAGDYAGAVVGQYPVDATATIQVENCYYRTGCLTINNEAKNYGNGSIYNHSNDIGCTRLTSASDSHNCLSVSSAETKANCTYPGRSAHSFCLICGTVTSGTRTVTPANSTAHVYSPSDCLTDGICQVCSHNKGKDPDKHHSSEYTYSPSATDPRKHDIFHKCCNTPTGESAVHTYEDYLCKLCNARCPHDNFTNGICNDCRTQGDRYIYYEWNGTAGELTQKYGIAPATTYNGQMSLSSGWYIVKGTKTVNQRIMINGDVHLILADGAHLNATKGIALYQGKSLHIYAQSTSLSTAGKLTAQGTGMWNAGIGGSARVPYGELDYALDPNAGALTIHGGVISATGGSNAAGIGATFGLIDDYIINCGSGDSVTIFGGRVTAKGGSSGAGIGSGGGQHTNAGTVTVRGGTVKAEGTKRATGIGSAQINGRGADIVITGGSVWAIAGFDPEADYTLQPIGGGQQVPNEYTLKNANDADLSLYTLVLDGAAVSAQVTAISGTAAASYGVSDVYTQEGGKLYFYLPKDTDIASAVSSVTAGGKTYWYSETSENGEHVYGLHAHSWTFSLNESKDAIVAFCSGSGTCPVADKTVTIQLTAPENLTYDGQLKEVTVTQTPAGVFTDVPAVSYCCVGGCVNAGEHTASLTYGGVTAGKSFVIEPINIIGATVGPFGTLKYSGQDQVPEADVTLANGMTVTGTWTPVKYVSDTTDFIASGNFTGMIEDQATGMHKDEPTAADFIMTPPDNLFYTGESKTATVSVGSYVDGMGAITVKYSPENPVNEGSYDVLIDVTEGDNYTAVSDLKVGSFVIGKSGSAFSEVKTYLDHAECSEFTYGQTVTVKGNVQPTGAEPVVKQMLRSAPTARQVALFDAAGTAQISEAASLDSNGAFVLTYDTTSKLVQPATSVTLMVKFIGDDNMANESTTISFKLNPKTLTPVSAEATSREYDPGNVTVSVTDVMLDGVVIHDNVGTDGLPVNGTLASDAANTYTSVVLPQLTLFGTDAAFYSIHGTTAATDVTIYPKPVAAPAIILEQNSFVYDGTEKKPAVTAVKDGEIVIPASEYTVSYSNNVNAGTTAMVSLEDAEGGNYTVSGSTTFAITQTQTAMTAQTDDTTYTYGEVITVTGTADVPQPEQQRFHLLRAFTGPDVQQVALYDASGNQLTDGVDVVNGEYTIAYDTKEKGILPGEGIRLTVKFVGDSNLSNQTALTNAFVLAPKSLTPSLSGSVTKPYDGTTEVPADNSLTISVSGVLGSDQVALSGSYAYDNAEAGTYKTVYASSITLSGADEPFYTLSADTASAAAGEITKAQIAPGNGSLNVANNQKKTYTYDLSQLLPALDGGKTYGSVSYQLGAISLGSHYSGGAAISNAMLKLPIEAERGSSVDVGTVNITIASDNFDFTADAVITVKQGAQIPEIEEQPASASYLQGAHNASLKVKAKITDGGKLTYQWYSNAANSNAGGTPISGANGANYKPSTDTVGTMYYYCVVTNTNDKAAGEKTASVVSRAAAVTVLPAVVTHDADITIIGQPNTTYENVHAKMMPLGSTAPLHDRVLQAIANTSPVQYLYHETAADGLYNLVITAEEASSHKTVTLTTLIDLQGHNDRHEARLPEADKSSIVEDNSELGIIAGKVEEVAATQALADPDGHLEVTLTTEQGYDPQTALADAPKIMLQASEDRKEIEVELDIDLLLHQFDANGSEISQINLGSSNVQRLEILIPVKTAGRMPEGFAVYRVHNGQLQKLPYGAGDEYFTVDMRGEFIKLYVKHFSSYAIGYGEPIPQALPTPPKTGDDSQLSLWLMLLAASLMGMSALLLSRKRKIN